MGVFGQSAGPGKRTDIILERFFYEVIAGAWVYVHLGEIQKSLLLSLAVLKIICGVPFGCLVCQDTRKFRNFKDLNDNYWSFVNLPGVVFYSSMSF